VVHGMAGRAGEAEDSGLSRGIFGMCFTTRGISTSWRANRVRHQGGTASSNPACSSGESAANRDTDQGRIDNADQQREGMDAPVLASRLTPNSSLVDLDGRSVTVAWLERKQTELLTIQPRHHPHQPEGGPGRGRPAAPEARGAPSRGRLAQAAPRGRGAPHSSPTPGTSGICSLPSSQDWLVCR
jgi:S-DNA-T family DNA segregation ATPase FtsK/SpoIIIE